MRRKKNSEEKLSESVIPFKFSINNSEAIIRENDENKKRNYFNLPVKEKVNAPHVLPESNDKKNTNTQKKDITIIYTDPETNIISDKTMILPTVTIDNATTPKQAIHSIELGNQETKSTFLRSFTIQLGAFKSLKQASEMIAKLKTMQQVPKIKQTGELYRVIVGSFETRNNAQAFAKENLGANDYYIRKRSPDE